MPASEADRKLLKGLIVNAARLVIGIGRAIRFNGDATVEQAETCAVELSESLCDFMDGKED